MAQVLIKKKKKTQCRGTWKEMETWETPQEECQLE